MKIAIEKNYFKFLYTFFLICLFVVPLLIFGIEDIEDYEFATFNSWIISKNYFNPFIFFIDMYGPGTEFPMSTGLYFHPLIIFIDNIQLFLILFCFFHLSIICIYFYKISKLYKIDFYIYLAVPLLIFSSTNFTNLYANDWYPGLCSHSFIFILFYQFKKILNKNNLKDFIKFSIFFYFYYENGHPGIALGFLIFLSTILLFSKNKKILRSYKPYLFLIILSFLLSEKIYFIGSMYLGLADTAPSGRTLQSAYNFSDFVNSFWPFYSYYRVYDRLPPNPYLIVISLILLFKYFRDNKNLEIKMSFIINLIFIFTPLLLFVKALPGPWWLRDYVYILACLIFFSYFGKLDKKIQITSVIIIFTYILCVYAVNVRGVSKAPNNYYSDNVKDYKLLNFFNNLKIDGDFNRLYFGKEAFTLLNRPYAKTFRHDINTGSNSNKYGIYNQTDLVKYNLIPFNGAFKSVLSARYFEVSQEHLMYTLLYPNMNHISNPLFLSIFHIKYSFVSENDLKNISTENYKIIKKIFLDDQYFYIIKNKIKFLKINNIDNLNQKISTCKKSKIDCILENHTHFDTIDVKFKRIKNGSYKFSNTKQLPINNIVLPFVYSNNWKCNNKKCDKIDDFLIYYKKLDNNLVLNYQDKKRFFLKALSLINLLILIIFLAYIHFKKYSTAKIRK